MAEKEPESGSAAVDLDDFGADLIAQYNSRHQIDPGDEQLAAQIGVDLSGLLAADPNLAPPTPAVVPSPEASTAAVDSPSQEPQAATDSVPVGSAATPGGTAEPAGTALPPPEPGTSEQPPETAEVGGYVWRWSDEATQAPAEHRFTDEQVQEALRVAADERTRVGLELHKWAESLAPEQRNAMGAVAQGQAVAVPRADWDRFQAWQHAQQTAARLPADLDSYDPEAAKVIREQAEKLAAYEATLAQQPAQPQPQYSAEHQALARQYDDAISQLQRDWRLTDDERMYLLNEARPFVASLQMHGSRYHPVTGELWQAADPGKVMHEAFSFALTRNPELYNLVASRAQALPNQPTTQASAQTPPLAPVTDINAKRARAASLAAAPSAAVTPSPRTVLQMTDSEVVGAMAEELDRVIANGGGA